MLRKVLRHDLGAIYKIWVVISITCVALGAIAGVALRFLMTPVEGPEHFTSYHAMAGMFFAIAVIGIIAYMVICFILVIYRYYQNFFTDEGYLTFTLPVKRYTLLNAKLINAFIWECATSIVFIFSIVLIFLIAPSTNEEGGSLLGELLNELAPLFKLIIEFSDAWFWAYVVGFILLGISYYIFSSLLIYMCVTIGCIVAKKAKALIAILIYYAASTVMSTASYIIIPIGTYFAEAIDILGANANPAVSSLIWLAVLLCASACVLLLAVAEYKFILSRIENKLNLA